MLCLDSNLSLTIKLILNNPSSFLSFSFFETKGFELYEFKLNSDCRDKMLNTSSVFEYMFSCSKQNIFKDEKSS